MKESVVNRPLREQHYDIQGKPRTAFSSHWRAKRYIEKRGLIGMDSYFCRVCRAVHVGYPPRVKTNNMKLPGF